MSLKVLILGNGTSQIAPSFIVDINSYRYLFNVPESTQRLFLEKELKMSKLSGVYVTSSDWSCCSGVIPAYSNLFKTNFRKVPFHMPQGAYKLIKAVDFMPCSDDDVKKRWTFNEKVTVHSKTTFTPLIIPIENKETLCYTISLPPVPGKFNTDKADSLKVPKAKRGILVKQGFLKLEDGSVIQKTQVCSPEITLGDILVLHFTSEKQCIYFIETYAKKIIKSLVCVILIINTSLLTFVPLVNFLKQFQCKKIFLKDWTSPPLKFSSESFVRTNMFHSAYNKLLPGYAPEITYSSTEEGFTAINSVITLFPVEQEITNTTDFMVKIPERAPLPLTKAEQFEVKILGTGGAFPGVFRDVSCNVLKIGNTTIVVDMGEGGAFHLLQNNVSIDSIDMFYFTHIHMDHIYGLLTALTFRKKRALVIGPLGFERRVRNFLKESKLNLEVMYVDHKLFSEDLLCQKAKAIINTLNINIQTKLLKHKLEPNYGVRFSNTEVSVVFSGDTVPCENDAQLCQDADYVIHECNYEDDNEQMAIDRGHSCKNLIEKCLTRCNNKVIVLNHISQRSSSCLVLKSDILPIVLSFDGMTFNENIKKEWQSVNTITSLYDTDITTEPEVVSD
ncbi:hypothetical protein EIN_396910 [Entamoeba invadens IP1]|uniref:ribonuclease Z n=1 Tax=Entamoeba invadens IP1 TaxID=370355 RepID=A0A0A1UDF0_ENTIV|nr:hypothetical protein EIN_396910 [Entamoeba invadens IP1]ELP91841.1 hypothetical protein EIN_396910 [Entamoeba invadens IP1]|eukprot:XP_004258612.1 hypothetical protein EIN_396910 [Entamoeba invadens IP1]